MQYFGCEIERLKANHKLKILTSSGDLKIKQKLIVPILQSQNLKQFKMKKTPKFKSY